MDGKDVNASYLTILQREKFKPKSTGMHGYTIIFIILGLFIAEYKVVLATLRPIEDLQVTNIKPTYEISYDMMFQYFTNERDTVFRELKTIYGIGAHSSVSNPWIAGVKNRGKRKKEILVLSYSMLLALWTAIDFRICTLIFSIFEDSDNNQYEFQKRKCHSFFKEMYFAFLEFRKSLEGMSFLTVMVKQLGERPIQNDDETGAVYKVLELTSDFIFDVDRLEKQKLDEQMSQFFSCWSELNVIDNGKKVKVPSVPADYAYKYYKTKTKTIEAMYYQLQLTVKMRMVFELKESVFRYLTELAVRDFSYNGSGFWEIFYDIRYPTKADMWYMLMNEFTVDSQVEKIHRISKAIEIMKKIRLMHYTVMIKVHKNFDNFRRRYGMQI